jgi:hypothetical protein
MKERGIPKKSMTREIPNPDPALSIALVAKMARLAVMLTVKQMAATND